MKERSKFFSGYTEVLNNKIDPRIEEVKEIYQNPNKQELIIKYEQRVKELEEHSEMWAKSSGVGGRMAVEAYNEIEQLKKIIEDLNNGTFDFILELYDKKIDYLNFIKEDANFFQARKIDSLINQTNLMKDSFIQENSIEKPKIR